MVSRVQPADLALPLAGPRLERHASAVSYPHFNWLRFALASAVALWHASLIRWDYAGYLAVQIFLALSGWLIGGILLRTSREELPRFFFNRVTRIWNPYALAVLMVYAASALREPISAPWLEFLTYDLTFTHNLFAMEPNPVAALAAMPLHGTGNHFWSIAVEEQFYLGAPLVLLFLAGGRSLWLWLALAIAFTASAGWVRGDQLRGRGRHPPQPVRRLAPAGPAPAGRARRRPVPGDAGQGRADLPHRAGLLHPGGLVLAVPGERGLLGELAGGLSYSLYLNAWILVFVVHFVRTRLGLAAGPGAELVAYILGVLAAALHFQLVDRSIQHHRGGWYSPAIGRACRAAGYALFAAGLAFGIALWGAPLYG